MTYGQLERRAAAAAREIARRVPGHTVAMLHSNAPSYVPLFLGALWAGKSVAVLPTLAPSPLLQWMTAEAGAGFVLASEEFIPRLMDAGVPCWMDETHAEADPDSVPMAAMSNPYAMLLYTSGTTGRPKAVMLSERNILSNVEGCIQATGFDSEQVMLAILPLFHAYGKTVTLMLPLSTGSTVVIPEKFSPRAILQTIERRKVTCLVAVPGQYRLLTKDPTEVDASSLWLCIAGAERLPEQISQQFEARFGCPLLQGYGTTENSPVISLNPSSRNKPFSIGKPLPNLKVSVRDEAGNVLPCGEVGELCVEGDAVMLGYLNDAEATAKKLQGGVLHTGDKGCFDADGYLCLAGRADDLIKISGEKVYPAEVESTLEQIPGIEEAAVLALPDEKHGARLHAFISLYPEARLSENELRSACRERLEAYKIPRGFTIIEQMPRTQSGKTDRRALAAAVSE
jgi:long-chain acyl-CoA synthetase